MVSIVRFIPSIVLALVGAGLQLGGYQNLLLANTLLALAAVFAVFGLVSLWIQHYRELQKAIRERDKAAAELQENEKQRDQLEVAVEQSEREREKLQAAQDVLKEELEAQRSALPGIPPDALAARQLVGGTFNIVDLARRETVVKGWTFVDCWVFGPAIIASYSQGTFMECTWAEANDPAAVLWQVSPERKSIVGAIGVEDCVFRRCHFVRVALLVKPEEYRRLMKGATNQ